MTKSTLNSNILVELTGKNLLNLFNAIQDVTEGGKPTKKFSSRANGQNRTLKAIETLIENGNVADLDEHFQSIIAEMQPKAKAASKASGGTGRKKGNYDFNRPAANAGGNYPKNAKSLRALTITALSEKGGKTFKEVEAIVRDFDAARGKTSTTVERRAYELIRLINSANGYGIKHDPKTGKIQVTA